jgi:hypothetical protein
VLGRAEVLGQPALPVNARALDLAAVAEQHDGCAWRRVRDQSTDETRTRLRGPQGERKTGTHEIEDLAVALRELAFAAAQPSDENLAAARAHADRDGVLDPRRVQQLAIQLAVGQAATLVDF